MAVKLEVQFDKVTMQKLQRAFKKVPKKMPQIMSRAINRTAKMARTDANRQIRTKIKIKAGAVNKAINIRKATRRIWIAVMNISNRRIPLINFGAKETKRGVSYSIEKGKRNKIGSAFIRTMESGHRGVFKRRGKARYPIIQLMGPSLGAAFENAGQMVRAVQAKAIKTLSKNIDDQIKIIFEKMR